MTGLTPPVGLVADMLGLTADARRPVEREHQVLPHQGILLSRTERSLIMITASVGADGELIERVGEAGARDIRRPRGPLRSGCILSRRGLRRSLPGAGYSHRPCLTRTAVMGLGPEVGLYTLWMMTKELAKADMALARCWEGHVNSQMLLNALGDDAAEGSLV